MYCAAVYDGARIDWQCPRCQDLHPDPFTENSRVETQEILLQGPGTAARIGHVRSNS